MMADLLFLAGIGFLFAHELDAIQQKEWRFFFRPSLFADETGYMLFTALHGPLFVLFFWLWDDATFQFVLDVFLIGHAGVHGLLRGHPLINFDGWFSRLWIYGGAVIGAVHLVVIGLG